jgi:hypothetical protein
LALLAFGGASKDELLAVASLAILNDGSLVLLFFYLASLVAIR